MERKEILSLLDTFYTQKHMLAETIAYQNLQKARQNKDFQALEKSSRVLTFEIGKAKANGNKTDAKKLEQKLLNTKTKMSDVLRTLNMTDADLLPKYSCKICNDTGKKNGQFCPCYKRNFYRLLSESYNNKKLKTFKDFNSNLIADKNQQKQLEKIKEIFEKLANDLPNNKTHTFVLCGKTGVGKTFLAECLVSSALAKGKVASFVSAFEMNNNFLKYHTTFNDEKLYYYSILEEPDLLVIDDLGTEPILKNVTLNYFTALLDDRANKKKTTVVTTNLSLDDILNKYSDRIFSRLTNKADGVAINIEGEDLRIKK